MISRKKTLWSFGVIGQSSDNHFSDVARHLLAKEELGFCFKRQPLFVCLFQMICLLFDTMFLNGCQNQIVFYLTSVINPVGRHFSLSQ